MTFTLHEQVLDNLSDGITIQDTSFTIIYQNRAMVLAFGDHCGQKCYVTYERRDAVCEGCGLRKAFESRQANLVLRTAFEADGRTSFWENACIPLFDDHQNVIAGVEVCRNVSDRVGLEEEVKERNIQLGQLNKQLRESEEKYRIQFEKGLDAIFVADAETGMLLDCNPAALKLLGKERSEVVGHHHREMHPPEILDGEFARTFTQHLNEREGQILETQVLTKDGERRDVAIMASQFELRGRTVLQGVFRDITDGIRAEREKSLLEMQLKHSQKLESIGHLAAGIAHEINTPNQFIGDNVRFLQGAFSGTIRLLDICNRLVDANRSNALTAEILKDLETAAAEVDVRFLLDEIPGAIEQTLEGVDRVSSLVRSMKEFAHPVGTSKTPADLNGAIQNTVAICRNDWQCVANVRMDLEPELPLVPCLLDEFNQVILHLIVNAAHAIRESGRDEPGTITITTQSVPPWVEIRISDTGAGIPEAIREKVFDPFFTTREVGKGSGQGLALAHAIIVGKHGGSITFQTEMGRGTDFLIRLPMAAETEPAVSSVT
ncbi:MAG: PAS domain S-box protein [Patescibacteria group bacterium]|nr:PAS domain S-box protein [Patescibacteria group bacterium]